MMQTLRLLLASGDVDSINYLVAAGKMQESLLKNLVVVRFNSFDLRQHWEIGLHQ
ncbi:MAG: hypothetical protein ACLUTU_04215 [Blautia faecis]